METGFKIPKPLEKSEKPAPKPQQTETEQSSGNASNVQCPYRVPQWSEKPPETGKYFFEVLKNGSIIENIKDLQTRSYWTFGRLPTNDIVSQHPTSSRFHCVLQWKPTSKPKEKDADDDETPPKSSDDLDQGWYLLDLDSTHGTFLNKNRIKPNIYVRVKVGHMIKIGNSSRAYILCGPDQDQEEESPLTVTEMKNERLRQQLEILQQEKKTPEVKEDEGISWGMTEDAEEETDLSHNPFALTTNEELFLEDPKKTLRGFFEREGFDLEYKCDEMSPGTYICRVELPLDDEYGKPYTAEVVHKGKKKDCVVQCALEACRILDRNGVLRQATHEPRKRKVNNYSDSDNEDDFLDRTGDVEKKRMKKTPAENVALTYEELLVQEKELIEKLKSMEAKLEEFRLAEKQDKQKPAEDDDLDAFMTHLSNEKKMDKTEVRKLKIEIQRQRNENLRIKKMINIARPTNLPSIKKDPSLDSAHKTKLPLFGKRQFLDKKFGMKSSTEISESKKESTNFKDFEEEFDEDDSEKAGSSKAQEKKILPTETVSALPEKILEAPKAEDPPSPEEIEKSKIEEPKPDEAQDVHSPDADESREESEQRKKKKRNRIRIKEKNRSNVDINEEIFDEEKVSKWVPPENQSGDGITALNEKFGY